MRVLKSVLCATTAVGVFVLAGNAQAADNAADTATVEELIVTAEAVSRANNVVSLEVIDTLAGGQNIVDAIRLVPGVQIRGADAFNGDPWSYGINIRGFEVNLRSSKIGQTLDGLPLATASYYLGGAPAAKFLASENTARVQVNQGTADVGSPSTSALGGTIGYTSRDPSETFGGTASGTIASWDSYRLFGSIDTGRILGDTTRAYVSVAKLDTNLWPHDGETPAGLEQLHFEAKSVTEIGDLKVTARLSHDESDDDPIIEATRAFIESTGFRQDGSVGVLSTTSAAANEYWADEWAGIRDNTLGYVKVEWAVNDALTLVVSPYLHRQEGVGEFLPPYQEPRLVGSTPGALKQTLFAGSRVRTNWADNTGRAVLPYATGGVERIYTNLQGQQVRSSTCFNPDNTLRAGNDCSSAQSYRNSTYYHRRGGVVADFVLEAGPHNLRGGFWYENMDRDFGREWYPYIDIRKGLTASGTVYRKDFAQNFKTDIVKLHIADTWKVNERLTLDFGLQHYTVDIAGTSAEDKNFDANGVQISTTRLALSSNSDELLPSVGVVYQVNDQIQAFAGYSKNFGAIGDWALEKTGTVLDSLKPEVATNIDLGLRFKSERVRAAATLFDIKYDNAIVFLTNDFAVGQTGINYSAGTGGTYFNVNGGIHSRGVEASVDADFTDTLTAYAAVSITDAVYTGSFKAASYGGNGITVAKGNKVSGTPDYILATALNYKKDNLSGQLSVRRIGPAPGDAANTVAYKVQAYSLVDLSAAYNFSIPDLGQTIEARVAVNNVLDEAYIAGILDEFTQRYVVGAPRSVSLTVSTTF